MIFAAYMVAGFLIASVYAFAWLRGRRDRHHRLGFAIPFAVAAVASPIQIFFGDTAARSIAEDQPAKFASVEYVTTTGSHQPEYLGGYYRDGKVKLALRIPDMDSLLVGFRPGKRVIGLDRIPDRDRPRYPTLLHLAFDTMVGLGFALLAFGAWGGLVAWRRRRLPETPWFWRAGALSGVAAVLALECGWIVTEVGRQPFIVYGRLRTADAVTTASGVPIGFAVVLALYAALGVATALKRNPEAVAAMKVAAVLWVGVTLYAVLGGADFGAGLWDLTAGGAKRGAPARELIARSITPVWEANHVWLIFVLVIAWTGFPVAFAAVMTTLFVPLALAAVGIVLRGAGFALRGVVDSLGARRALGATFALSSVMTPFFLGTVVGAVAAGRVPIGANGDMTSSWLNLTSVTVGALFVATGAYISAVFLVYDARRDGEPELERAFARRALGAAVVAGLLAVAGLVVLRHDARDVYDGLTSDALPLVVLSGVCGVAALATLAAGRTARATRPLAVLAVASVIWAWGVAQHPDLLPGAITVAGAAAPATTLTALLVVTAIAVAVVGPSLALLFSLQRRAVLDD